MGLQLSFPVLSAMAYIIVLGYCPTCDVHLYFTVIFLIVLCFHCTGGGSGSGSAGVELDTSKTWIYITQRECHGLRELVEFLDSLDTADRHVPSEVQSPDELLTTAKVTKHINIAVALCMLRVVMLHCSIVPPVL